MKDSKLKKIEVKNKFVQNILVVLGVILLCIIIVYLMNYFFVEKNYIKINMSTDKKVEYITINGNDVLMTTQKYVSDLNYTMRYDIDNFKVSKYRNQDIYRYKNAEKIVLIVQRANMPESCMTSTSENSSYDSCIVKIDNYTKEYYYQKGSDSYRITVKTPNVSDYEQNINVKINYMLKSFTIRGKAF